MNSTGFWLLCPYAVPVVGLSILLLPRSFPAGIVWGSLRVHPVANIILSESAGQIESRIAREFVQVFVSGRRPFQEFRLCWEGDWRLRGRPNHRQFMRPIVIQFAFMDECWNDGGRWLEANWRYCRSVTVWERSDGRLFASARDAV